MKKFWGIMIFIILSSSFTLSQMKETSALTKKIKNNQILNPNAVINLEKTYIGVYAEDTRGRFTIRTMDNRDLLFIRSYGGGLYTTHANIKINGTLYSQNDASNFPPLPKPNIYRAADQSKLVCDYGTVKGLNVTQEFIPKENFAKKSGAILIKYTFYNPGDVPVKVGAALKLDTKIGGVGWEGGTDSARIATQTKGLIRKAQYIARQKDSVPDFWLAFENPVDTSALVGRGTMRGKDLVVPDVLYVGNYADIQDYGYKDSVPLSEGIEYNDSALLLEWNEVDVPAKGTVFFSTLYGMADVEYQVDKLILTCSAPFDTLTLNPQSNYEVNPFDYLVTIVKTPGSAIDNVWAKITFGSGVFNLGGAQNIQRVGTINPGDYKLASWKIYTSNQFVSKMENIRVDVYSTSDTTLKDFCITKVFVPANLARLTIAVNPLGKGSTTPLSPWEGAIGSLVPITATSSGCWVFDKWTGDFNSSNSSDMITMDKSKDIVANFKLKKYTLTTVVSPTGSGTINKSSDSTGYSCGSSVTLTPVPVNGFRFVNWSGDASGNTVPLSVIMNVDKNIIANFEPDSFTLVININPPTAGKAIPPGGKFKNGDVIPITASATDYCYKFKNWTGDTSASDTTINVKMWKNKTLIANFELKKFKLSIQPFQNGKVTITPTPTADSSYTCGTPVRITAVADKCYGFEKWSTNYGNFEINDTTLQVYADITGKPIFTINKVKLSTSVYPAGSGRVNGKPSDIVTYNCGENPVLVANPESCYNFSKWSDGDTNITKIIKNLDKDSTLRAEFVKKRFSLSTKVDFPGGGTIDRDKNFSLYDCGDTVGLTIKPSTCFNFIGWSGDTNSTNLYIPLYIYKNRSVVANMALTTFSVNKVTNNFPNIVLDLWLDYSTIGNNNLVETKKIPLSQSDLTLSDSVCSTSKKINNKDYVLIPQQDGTYKIVYALIGCYNQACDTSRQSKIAFKRDNCSDIFVKPYSLALNSGCDSCSRLLRRKDTTGHLMMKLFPNHPNPFNPETRIRYSISQTERVSLKIYDILGRAVSILVDETQEPGEYEAIFVPRELPSGVYFYHLSAGTFNDLKKMLYVK